MKRVRTIGLCLAAVFTVSAMVTASASATLPEFKTSFPVTFKSESLSPLLPTFSNTQLNMVIACVSARDSGALGSAKLAVKVLVAYNECKVDGLVACTTSGRPSGTILTLHLLARPGYFNVLFKEVGLEVWPEASDHMFASFQCGVVKLSITGCTIAEAFPINLSSTTSELLFEENTAKMGQKWTKFASGPECTLEWIGSNAWLMDREMETFSKAVELTA